MAFHNNPRVEGQKDLLFYIDAKNPKSMSGAGAGGFASHDEGLTDLVDKTRKAKFAGDAKAWGKLRHYTMVAITYPEGNYGGSWAGRDGLMEGYNTSSGTKTFDFTRDLHLYVWDPATAGWVNDSYFNGERNSGHCYDNYENPSTELPIFVSDYNALSKAYPKGIYVLAGSHANDQGSYWTSTEARNILKNIGAPSTVDSWSGRKEWCMVGAPNLGTGNAYGWAYENGVGQDAAQVAHLNFRLPRNSTRRKGIHSGDIAVDFDGTGDYLDLGSDITFKSTGGWTVESWVKYDSVAGSYNNTTSPANFIGSESISYNSWYWSVLAGKLALWNMSPGTWRYGSTTLTTGRWYQTVLVCHTGGLKYQMYLNGVAEGGDHTTYTSWSSSHAGLKVRYFGRGNAANVRYMNGQMSSVKIYDRVLTAEEIKRNYRTMKHRAILSGTYY